MLEMAQHAMSMRTSTPWVSRDGHGAPDEQVLSNSSSPAVGSAKGVSLPKTPSMAAGAPSWARAARVDAGCWGEVFRWRGTSELEPTWLRNQQFALFGRGQ